MLKLVYFPSFKDTDLESVLGSCCGLFLLGRTEKNMKKFRLEFSVVAETVTGHFLVCYHVPFCIMPLHKHLHIYNSYDYDCDQFFWLHVQ